MFTFLVMTSIGRHCILLQVLDVTCRQLFTDSGVKAVLEGCRLLNCITINVGFGVTVEGVKSFQKE